MDLDKRLTRSLQLLGIIAIGVALLWAIGSVLAHVKVVLLILIGSVFFAYLLYPAVRALQVRRFPRWLAIAVVYMIIIIVLGTAGGFGGPALVGETRNFSAELPLIVRQLHDMLVHAHTSVLSAVPIETRQTAADYLDRAVLDLQTAAGAYTGQALTIVLSVVSVISGLVIVPILAFYILLDSERLGLSFINLFPVGLRSQVTLLMRDIDVVLSGFIRGQILVAAFVAFAVTVALLSFGIRYAVLIGVFAGLADMIPYVGAVAGAVPAILVAFLTYGPLKALFVGLAFLVIYELEGHFVAPAVVGKRVGLSALLVIVAILMGAEFGGIVGMFVAVPVAAIIRVLWRRLIYPLEVAQASTPVPATEPTAKTIVIVSE